MQKIILSCLILLCFNASSFSQCAVYADFELSGYSPGVLLTPLNTSFPVNWMPYKFEWKVDNVVKSTQVTYYSDFGGETFHKVCLLIYGSDTITNDSCIASHCNIFYSDQNVALVQMGPVQNTGTNVTFNISGSGSPLGMNVYVAFGDGTDTMVYTNSTITHTYPNPGNKTITAYDVGGFGQFHPINSTVHVGTGVGNFNSFGTYIIDGNCDSVYFSANSSPQFFSADFLNIANGNGIGTGVPASGYMGVKMPYPGYFGITGHIQDSTGGTLESQSDFIVQDCNYLPDTVTGTVFSDIDADGIFDPGETGIPGKEVVLWNYKETTDSAGYYEILIPLWYGFLDLNANSIGITTPIGYSLTFFTNNPKHTNYNFGLANLVAQICGKAYIDYNGDSIYNTGDVGTASVIISAFDTTNGKTYSTSTDAYGNYCMQVPAGYFILKANQSLLDSVTVYPDSVILNNPSGNVSNLNFALSTSGSDLGIHLNSNTQARPGFNYSVNALITNHRTDTSSADVVISYDAALTYTGSQPAGGIHDAINHTVSWTSGNILPANSLTFTVNLSLPVSIPLGTTLNFSGSITPSAGFTDAVAANNTYSFTDVVIGSFDPNDKLVSPRGDISGTEALHYRINFQNTGTASAINVSVQDVLDNNLDLSTFVMERTSHNCRLVMQDHTLTWQFYGINLPDSNSNEPLSHGFIEYTIKPLPGLANSTVIANMANIYFDFNAPVATNTTNTTVVNTTSLTEKNNLLNDFKIVPNPASSGRLVTILFNSTTVHTSSFIIYDVSGRKVFTAEVGSDLKYKTIPLPQLAPGIYECVLQNTTTVGRKKLVIVK